MNNKEIEELLNYYRKEVNKYEESSKFLEKKFGYSQEVINSIDQRLYQRYRNHKLLLSHIEQLEIDYKEANESVTWWQNRYNAIVKQNDDNHKKVVKLENNRDKAIEYVEEKGRLKYNPNELINLLKGDSDE